MSLIVYTAQGTLINLQVEIGRGGEGAIFALPSRADECAKIYSKALSAQDARKLHLMVNNPPRDPAYETSKYRSIAWPSALLFGDKDLKTCVGFIMPKLDTKQFRKAIYYVDPKDRKRYFGGGFNWKYIFTACFNLVSSIAAIHERGYCIGDLNESNILIAPSALIALIDCDSFQVCDPRSGLIYRCPVGKPEYTAPEIQGRSYRDVNRSPETDCFALCVFLFQFMMAGTHPYQAKGRLVEDAPSTHAKLIKGLFPYSSHLKGIAPPDYAPPFGILPPEIRELFCRCFGDGHRNPAARPSAREWFSVMKTLGSHFRQCSDNENHVFHDHLSSCPWCQIAKQQGEDPFPSPLGQQFALDPITVASEGLEKRLEAFRPYLLMAFADGVLTTEEEQQLKALGSKLQIPLKEVDKAIQNEAKKTQIKSAAANIGQPRLEISQTQFEFNNLRASTTVQGRFVLNNVGGGILRGSIRSTRNWLKPLQIAIDPSRHRQEISFNVDTTALPFGFKERAQLDIRSNGGAATVAVDLSLEIPASAIGRFRIGLAWIGVILGGMFGFALYQLLPNNGPFDSARDVVSTLAACLGLVGAVVLGSKAGGFGGGCGGFILVFITLAILEKTWPKGFSIVSWAITYGAILNLISRPIFTAWQANRKHQIVAIGAGVLGMTVAIIASGTYISEQINSGPFAAVGGNWQGSFNGSQVANMSFQAQIQQNGAALSGRIVDSQAGSAQATAQINGFVKGNEIQFQKRYSDHAVLYTGRISGDSMSGTWTFGYISGSWQMYRVMSNQVQSGSNVYNSGTVENNLALLVGNWKGTMAGHDETLIIRGNQGRLEATVSYPVAGGNVDEELSVELQNNHQIMLRGLSYRLSHTSAPANFSLDTFYGQIKPEGPSMWGTWRDGAGGTGNWFVKKISAGPTTTSSLRPNDFDPAEGGESYGINYAAGVIGRAATFSSQRESRIEFPNRIPRQGTLEWWIKVDSAYHFDNFKLIPNERCALLFTSDAQGGDVTWPGATKLYVCNDGEITLDMAQAKYNDLPHQQLKVSASSFRFGQWHALGITYGSEGQVIMLDGQRVGFAPSNTQWFGAAGMHEAATDIPTIGEAVSHFWQHRQYSGGFEGSVNKFRVSPTQNDWLISAHSPESASP